MKPSDEILAAIERIKRVVLDYSPGYPNAEAKRLIKADVEYIRARMPHEKLYSILGWTDILYSARKWKKYNGGADQIARWMISDCDALSSAVRLKRRMLDPKTDLIQ